jgi:hypothetical protein
VPARNAARALTVLVTTLLVLGPTAAWAQPEPPPPVNELKAAQPWTYWMARAGIALAVLSLAAFVIGYLVKGREFRANQRRGGSK